MEDELVSRSFLLPPSLDFVPDDPERVRLSEAAVSAFQSGRMRSASRARLPGSNSDGNIYIPPDHDDEVRMGQSPSVSPELAGDGMQHILEGAFDGSIATRKSSTSPLRHGFSKSITGGSLGSQTAHYHRRSTGAGISFDETAEGPSWGRLCGDNSAPPRNLLAQAAMQVLRESDDINSMSTGVHRGRPPGRDAGRYGSTTGTYNPDSDSNVGPASRGRSSPSLASSIVPNQSRMHSRHGSVASTSASVDVTRGKARAPKPVGFGSGAPSSRAATGLQAGNARSADRGSYGASPVRRVSNAGSSRTSEPTTLSRQQSSADGGRISIQDVAATLEPQKL